MTVRKGCIVQVDLREYGMGRWHARVDRAGRATYGVTWIDGPLAGRPATLDRAAVSKVVTSPAASGTNGGGPKS